MEFPRFFLPSESEATTASEASYVLDSFHLGGVGEVMVGLDAAGALLLEPLDNPGERLPSIRAHLAHAEVATASKRGLDAAPGGLWLMALDLVEQLPDAPGVNDPIYLYGTLYMASGDGRGTRGQLTATRGDLLRGVLEGLPWAFRYPPDAHDRIPRAFHALLPADRAEAIEGGHGLVLAYPAMDPALFGDHAGNELAVLAMLHDTLAALLADPERDGSARSPLPVPDRAVFVSDLEARGWTIEEDEDGAAWATREPVEGGLLKRLFGGKERLAIPPQATVELYAERVRAELGGLTGWPSRASRALFARVQSPYMGDTSRRGVPVIAMPRPPAHEPPPPPPPRPPPADLIRARRDEWMQDFVGQHRQHQPRLTPLGAEPRAKRPDWMKDFE